MAEGLPRISIVTPSYNQAPFLEATIQSVLAQNYPNLEYIVMDGGSTDGSIEILQRYDRQLTAWVSEPDGGQYDAINRGFARTTGEIMAWINSDDLYHPWAFQTASEIFTTFPEVEWITTLYQTTCDDQGRLIRCQHFTGFSRRGFWQGEHATPAIVTHGTPAIPRDWLCTSFIPQESTFWRRSLWEKAGGQIDASLKLAGDFELWARFYQQAHLYGVGLPLGIFRSYLTQKSSEQLTGYFQEVDVILTRYGKKRRSISHWREFLRAHAAPYLPLPIAHKLDLVQDRRYCFYDRDRRTWYLRQQWL